MISCRDVKDRLWEYYDGECAPEGRDAISVHLAQCRGCQRQLDEWVAISHAAFARKTVQAPPFLWTRVLAGIEAQEEGQGRPWWVQWRWMSRVTSVASVVVSLVALYLFSNTAPSLESLLQGHGVHQQAIQEAKGGTEGPDGIVLALGEEQ